MKAMVSTQWMPCSTSALRSAFERPDGNEQSANTVSDLSSRVDINKNTSVSGLCYYVNDEINIRNHLCMLDQRAEA